ncbi:hypothetical protein BLA29_008175, partial [Euroglyphus maynei]
MFTLKSILLTILLSISLIQMIKSDEEYWEFLDYIPKEEKWEIIKNTPYPVPSYHLPSEKVIDISEPGYYEKAQGDNLKKVIGTIRVYSPDPTKVVVFYLVKMYIICQHKSTSTFIRWFDGWNIGDNIIIPYVLDRGHQERFSDNLCELGRRFRLKFIRYTASQNFAQIDYLYDVENPLSFSFFVYFKDNPQRKFIFMEVKACHALILDSLDVQRYEASLRIKYFQVGDPTVSNVIKDGEKNPIT